MITVDAGDITVPTDIIDAGDTATPPADFVDSFTPRAVQAIIGADTPTFTPVDFADTINPDSGLVLYVRVGATATDVTMQVPGVQPYTGAPRADVIGSGLQNTERVFYLADVLFGVDEGVAVASYSQTTGVTSALFKVR